MFPPEMDVRVDGQAQMTERNIQQQRANPYR